MPARPKGARILVVDDHLEMARLLTEQLGEAGYSVEHKQGGREALRAVRAELPDLVITDLRMVEVDGFDVLAGVHDVDPAVPVIVMTAFGSVDTAVEAMKLGAFDYINKPFKTEELLLTLERARRETELRREVAALRRRAGEGKRPKPLK